MLKGGTDYTDAGATVTDSFEGDINASLTVDNPVETSKLGEYTVTYSAKDSSGNEGTITRKVIVEDTIAPSFLLKVKLPSL